METPAAKILVVDDTDDVRLLLHAILKKNGFDVVLADGAAMMDACLAEHDIDVIILDSMMPVEDGLSVCKRISEAKGPPILMLSAKGEDLDRIKGLELGAEDYMSKPFNADELIARLKVILRRGPVLGSMGSLGSDINHFFGWKLDNRTRRITAPSGQVMAMSKAEYAVLRVLLDHPDQALKRETILNQMVELHEYTSPRALDTLISRLRKKLAELNPQGKLNEELIQTVYGVGYGLRKGN